MGLNILTQLCGFSGTHGVGKSTLLKELANISTLDVTVHNGSLSRNLQSKLNINVKDISNSFTSIVNFQESVLAAMIERDNDILSGHPGIHLVDRTPVDIISYCYLWLDELKRTGVPISIDWFKWIHEMEKRCYEHHLKYSNTFFIHPASFDFVEEENRASRNSARKHHEFINYWLFDTSKFKIQLPVTTINQSLDNRKSACIFAINEYIALNNDAIELIESIYLIPLLKDNISIRQKEIIQNPLMKDMFNLTLIDGRLMYSLTQKSFKLWRKINEFRKNV